MIDLQAFGTLEVRTPTGPAHAVLAQPKRAALLAYLAFRRPRGFRRRDELLTVFWPESETASARNALSRSLSFLRQHLPDGLIVTRGIEEVGLDATAFRSDVAGFEEAVARGDHEEAVALYRGPFLHALHVAGAPDFERWAEVERERLREQASQSAWAAAGAHIAAGRFVEAERMGQRALAWSPTDESAVREFIAALAPGDRAAALRFHDRFAAVLAEELDVEPAPETMALAEAIRAGDPGALRPRSPVPTPPPPAEAAGPAGVSVAEPLPATESLPASSAPPARRWPLPLVAGALVVLALAAGVWGSRRDGTGRPGTLIGEGRAERYASVLVADLASPSDPTLGMTAAEWLRAELDQSEIVRPVGTAAIGAALRRMVREPSLPVDGETAREIAIRDGYPLLVTGAIAGVGSEYLITVRLESPDGEVYGRYHASAPGDADFPAALDRIGGEIRARIGESRRSIRRSPPLEQVTTGSLDALRLYTEAVALASREGRYRDAIPLLEGAIALDDGFATALRELRITLTNLGLRPDRQEELDRLAYAHRDRLTPFERLRVEATYVTGNAPLGADECATTADGYRLYEGYVRAHPDDPRPLSMYAYYSAQQGRHTQAIDLYRRAIERGWRTNVVYNNLFYEYLRSGDTESAGQTLEAWEAELPTSAYVPAARADLLYAAGEYAAADSAWAVEAAGSGGGAERLQLAAVDLLRGRVTEAMAHHREATDRGETLSWPTAAGLTVLRLAAHGDTATVDPRWIQGSPDPVNYGIAIWYETGLYYAATGDPQRAREALDTLDALGAGDGWLVRGLLRAAAAAAAGDPGSLDALRTAESGCTFTSRDYRFFPLMRGRVLETLGRTDEAIAAYEEWLAGRPLFPRWDAVFRFDTLERTGRLHEQRGDRAAAARYFIRAADLWQEADPALQPRVQRLRARAARLVAEG